VKFFLNLIVSFILSQNKTFQI